VSSLEVQLEAAQSRAARVEAAQEHAVQQQFADDCLKVRRVHKGSAMPNCPDTDSVLMQKNAAAHSLKSTANRPSKLRLCRPVGALLCDHDAASAQQPVLISHCTAV
jgi:hypothetical protein